MAFDRLKNRFRKPQRPDQSAADHPVNVLLMGFVNHLHTVRDARVIELGTKRTSDGASTVHRDWAAADATFFATDFEAGVDVDMIADVQALSDYFEPGSIDAVIGCSVFEHVKRPWLAAAEIGKVLKPGGQVLIQTHFSFPLHGYPNDYWRYSIDALEMLFAEEGGLRIIGTGYQYPVDLVAPELASPDRVQAFLNSCVVAEKPLG